MKKYITKRKESTNSVSCDTLNQLVFLDPAVARKSKIVDDTLSNSEGWPLPSVVEISESGTCNRVCSFCPRSAPDYPDVKEFIKPALLKKLVAELGELSYEGIFIFSGFVEPMLDKNIYQHIGISRQHMPKARIEMVTNGDVLTPNRLLKLFDSGLSTLLISVYDGPEDAERFKHMYESVNLTDEKVVIRHRYLPESENFGITINNRAGMMADATYSIPTPIEPLRAPCNYPHYTFFMDYQGDVLLCPHDWGKKLVVANLNHSSFREAWLGKILVKARERLSQSDRGFIPCSSCDVHGSLIGNDHVVAWEKHLKVLKK